MIEAYPLSWPEGWPRTHNNDRTFGRFSKQTRQHSSAGDYSWNRKGDISVSEATKRLTIQLDRMGIDREDIIISTNLKTRLDGLPKSGQRAPEDPGAAVYWENAEGNALVVAIDLYTKVEHNLAAIAATLDALRGIERWGGAKILERAFTGFAALEHNPNGRWRDIIKYYGDNIDDAKQAFRVAIHAEHPDHGGDADKFQILLKARDQMRAELAQ